MVPHTSWLDIFVGLLVRSISGESINFVGKKELFTPLTGWFFRTLGGAPIDRSGNKDSVESIAAVFEAHEMEVFTERSSHNAPSLCLHHIHPDTKHQLSVSQKSLHYFCLV